MKFAPLKILSTELLKPFKHNLPKDFHKRFSALQESPLSTRTFSFYTSVSAIASSRIEGEAMEMDSYLKHKMLKVKYLPELVQKPNDSFAAHIHLTFVKIHPFEDGNGRAARLVEKWFLAEKLGPKAWFLQSELHYYQNVVRYYAKALPFLLMLTKSVEVK